MEAGRNVVVVSLSLFSLYFVYAHIYRSHRLLRTNVLHSDHLPSLVYVYVKYLLRVIGRRAGCLVSAGTQQLVYTLTSCSVENSRLRRFCSRAGYGWDYPDTEYRDIPLCFPEFLCCRLLDLLFTDENFRLSPAGLVRVRQRLKTLQPVDELKKGPFTLQARALEYRQGDAGVEVDVCLTASSRSGSPVWESVLTLLSRNKLHKPSRCSPADGDTSERHDDPLAENETQVELSVPTMTGLRCLCSFSDSPPHRLLSVPFGFLGFRSQTVPSLWVLSVCLAEIEKHRGVEVITAPVNVTAQFMEPLLAPGKVRIRFWDQPRDVGQSCATDLSFSMEQRGRRTLQVVGRISRF
ncbi:uncharacterized protein si:ch211-12e13.1 [Cololabis saira]|uniref:uncharacterized protein si:ch211-12e13.1 n=1 Tax=Cololabis saira TaxID=129043 RepID=UPI002AD58D46|nr:uncharacterized protein si:ch211-12e13.1 [Cololabis saira]